MRAAVVNVSHPHYNLGSQKLADWLTSEGHDTTLLDQVPTLFLHEYDLVALSVIFSWDAPKARDIALQVKDRAEVWAGGPGLFGEARNGYQLRRWWKEQTGIEAHVGLDPRFEKQRGNYRMTFASRGCPVNCYFCLVPKLEGRTFTLDWDFTPAPILCDNNLSALPVDFQQHIIERYRAAQVPLLDANSGFEPRAFDDDTYRRWKPLLRGPWRFAFDIMPEISDVRRVCEILKGESRRRKRVYVLINNEPIESCYERAIKVIEWGGEPFCQYKLPLDYLGGPIPCGHDWTEKRLKDFCRYFNRFVWRKAPLNQYRRRKYEPHPFGEFAYMHHVFPSPARSLATTE